MPDFYVTGDDYRFRFDVEAKERFIDLIREQFNSGAVYKGRSMKWDTVIQEKTGELGRYLSGRSHALDFSNPPSLLERADDRAIRERILRLTQSEARRRGIGKRTLHYLRKHANDDVSFRLYNKIGQKIDLPTE